MILTVTINPLLERRYIYSKLDLFSVNRNGVVTLKVGGKGINVNRQLNKLNISNMALLFAGGVNGKLIRDTMRKECIKFSEVNIKSETRDAAIIVENSANKIYSFFSENSSVSSNEVKEFIIKMEKAMVTCEIVVFSGSSPCSEADSIFAEGIAMANRLDKISICDTYGNHLEESLNASPTIVHNNIDEIEKSLGLKLKSEEDYINFLANLYKKGVKQAYITNDRNPFYASNFDFHYNVTLPEINALDSTGSGDAFVAGIVYGWHHKFTFEDQLRLATAFGVCNARSIEVCEVEFPDVESLVEKIEIKAVGKRLKEIYDRPG